MILKLAIYYAYSLCFNQARFSITNSHLVEEEEEEEEEEKEEEGRRRRAGEGGGEREGEGDGEEEEGEEEEGEEEEKRNMSYVCDTCGWHCILNKVENCFPQVSQT